MPPRKKKGTGIIDTIVYGRKDFKPSVKKVLDANADAKIVGLTIHRNVMPKILKTLLNLATKDETDKLIKETDKDKLFHVFLLIKLDNGKSILLEKNSSDTIKMVENPKTSEKDETLVIPAPTKSLTLRELIENTQKAMGDTFFKYAANGANCGDFIIEVLKSNDLITKEAHHFIFQNTEKILSAVPALNKIAQFFTDIRGKANVLIEGGGFKDSIKKKYDRRREKSV